VIKSSLNPKFKEFELNLGKMSNGDMMAPVICEFWDFKSNGNHEYVGEFTFSANSIVNEGVKEFKAINKIKKKDVGSFYVDYCKLDIRPSFLDYIRGGTQLALVGAIDFTASNGDPGSPKSLHKIDKYNLN
jgi:hypothetical protein